MTRRQAEALRTLLILGPVLIVLVALAAAGILT